MASHLLSEINRAVLDRFIAAWGQHNLEALMACVSDDFVYRASIGPEPGTTYSGHDAVRTGVQAMWAADTGSQAQITHIALFGDQGWIEWIYRWPQMGGRHHDEIGCDLVRFRDGRLIGKDAYRKVLPSPAFMPPTTVQPVATVESAVQIPIGVGYSTRYAAAQDAPRLMALMRQLAAFEGYADRMTVTENDLIERGLGTPSLGQFCAIVAQSDLGELWGYAVVYAIPFTYDLQPTLVLKEFLVTEPARGMGVGRSLFERVVAHARTNQCRLLKWDVLPSNERAKAFYRSCGGAHDVDWQNWILRV